MTSTSRAGGLLAGSLVAAALLGHAAPVSAQRGPAPTVTNLPADVMALACAPQVVYESPAMPLRITGGQDSFVRRAFAPGDLLTINAGRMNGISVGQEYFVRRLQISRREPVTSETPASIRTTGWIKVYAVDDEMSLVTVTHACDTIEVDDYLEPFALPAIVAPSPERGKPERDNYARVMVGQDRRRSFAEGDFVLIDRGSDGGVTPGAHFVFYRDKRQAENFLYDLGEAVAVEVTPQVSTLRVTVSRDVIQEGDYVSQRK